MDLDQVHEIKDKYSLYVEQDPEELQWLIDKVLEIIGPPIVVLEIGTSHGGTLKYWEQICREDALIIGIDRRERELVTWNIESSNRDIHHIEGDSHSPETLSKVEDILGGKAVDFLFVDGDHNGVKADYEDYSKLVRDAGVVGFHDVGPRGPCRRFFDEIRVPKHPSLITKEIFHKTIGIGYIMMLTARGGEL